MTEASSEVRSKKRNSIKENRPFSYATATHGIRRFVMEMGSSSKGLGQKPSKFPI